MIFLNSDFKYFLIILLIIYLIFTFTEWFTHKYIMHNKNTFR